MKRLYFLRHGEAEMSERGHDSERRLTEAGREKMAAAARGLKALNVPIDAIVTSPYVRARQTADQVALVYRLFDRLVESEFLEPGASFSDLRKALARVEGESLMVVGHAPDLGYCVGRLVGTAEIPLARGALAWVSLEEGTLKENSGQLMALLPADLLARLGFPKA